MNLYLKTEDGMYELNEVIENEMMMIEPNISVTYSTLECLLVDALEGGIVWGGIIKTVEWVNKPQDMPSSQYAFQLLCEGKTVKFYDVEEEEDDSNWILTMDKFLKGISLNNKNRPFDCDLDDYDADTCDCIIQYALFEDIVFG